MLRVPERGCLVIADISGYTGLLAGTELDHAQDALRDLLQTVVGQLRGQFRLSKLEGDAAFAYALGEAIDGPHLLDTLESAYFAFRRRLDAIGRATTCDCSACVRLPGLDLKAIAHHGTFIRERLFGTEELTGADVVIVHRLLKNHAAERLGHSGYALLTDDCLRAAGLDPRELALAEDVEEAEGIGAVRAWIHDLRAAWTAEQDQRRVRVTERQTMARIDVGLPVVPAAAWRYLSAPDLRRRWQPGVVAVEQELAGGRRGVGTVNHCVHGDGATLEEVLDWRPFEYFTLRSTAPGPFIFTSTTELATAPGGSHVTVRILRPSNARERAVLDQAGPMMLEMYRQAIDRLERLIRDDLAAEDGRAGAAAGG